MKNNGLYIHIPFCVSKCNYCDFLSFPAKEAQREAYLSALLCEISLRGKAYAKRGKINSLFFGGGTPSLLSCDQMERVMDCLQSSFEIDGKAEITFEANPGTLTREKLKCMRRLGVNRLSIGVQSANNELLRLLGRIHTWEDFCSTWEMVREEGFDNVNLDLMSGLPGQKALDWEDGLRKILALEPEHISAYSLIIEEGTPFFDWFDEEGDQTRPFPAAFGKKPSMPGEEEDREIYHLTKSLLADAGYIRYEISNYAKEGYACRHNLGYWQAGEYLGLGLGAASYRDGVRWTNCSSLPEYVELLSKAAPNLSLLEGNRQVLTKTAQMEEYMFLGLRVMEGISEKAFQEQFRVAFAQVYGSVTQKLIEEGLLMRKNGRICLTDRGIDVSNPVLAEFLLT